MQTQRSYPSCIGSESLLITKMQYIQVRNPEMKGVYELGRATASQIPSPLSYLLLHWVFVLVFLGQLQVWGVPFHDPPH